MNSVAKRVFRFLIGLSQILPFVVYIILFFVEPLQQTAFAVSASLALVQMTSFLLSRLVFDRFMLAINCFLLGGICSFSPKYKLLGLSYHYFSHTMIFFWLFLIASIPLLIPRKLLLLRKRKVPEYLKLPPAMLPSIGVSLLYSFLLRNQGILLSSILPLLFLVLFRTLLLNNNVRKFMNRVLFDKAYQ